MWIGNLMLVIINLPLVGLWVRLLRVPYRMLFPAILLFCAIGVYSINNQPFDVVLTAFFGLTGYMLINWVSNPHRCSWPSCSARSWRRSPPGDAALRAAIRGPPRLLEAPDLHRTDRGLCAAAGMAVTPALRKKRDEVFVED